MQTRARIARIITQFDYIAKFSYIDKFGLSVTT